MIPFTYTLWTYIGALFGLFAIGMGKYIGSPWGYIRGKLDDAVGGAWKGINWVRVRILPTQRGTLPKYRLFKDGLLDPSQFSYPQFNIRRCVLQVLGYVARFNITTWIRPVWEELVTKRGWVMTGTNAFVRRNAATFFSSMLRTAEYVVGLNEPDLLDLLVSDGDLEAPASITLASYNPVDGNMGITWDASTFTNGAADDVVQVIILKKPLLESVGRDGTWYPALFAYPFIPAPPSPAFPGTRADAAINFALPAGLTAADLTAYLFFRDAEGTIGYSPSLALQVT